MGLGKDFAIMYAMGREHERVEAQRVVRALAAYIANKDQSCLPEGLLREADDYLIGWPLAPAPQWIRSNALLPKHDQVVLAFYDDGPRFSYRVMHFQFYNGQNLWLWNDRGGPCMPPKFWSLLPPEPVQ